LNHRALENDRTILPRYGVEADAPQRSVLGSMSNRRSQWKEWKSPEQDRTARGFISNAKSLDVDVVHFAPSLLTESASNRSVLDLLRARKTPNSRNLSAKRRGSVPLEAT
jgi:hypothetical protein